MSYIGIEAGGTKVVCATGSGPDDVTDVVRFPTTTPSETLGAVAAYITTAQTSGPVEGVGLATFGPVHLDRGSSAYGQMSTTPKPGWAGADLLSPLRATFDGPVGLDTDVNGAALGELRWGAGVGLASLAYVTVGTGIGVGAIVDGSPIHGLLHPEMGHIVPRRHPEDTFEGRCPAHGDCLEGLACGPAWLDRWGVPSTEMDDDTRRLAVDIQAYYMGQLVTTIVLAFSPHRIVIGGGVLAEPSLLPRVREHTVDLLAGYVAAPAVQGDLTEYLVPPGLGDRAGVLGAIAMATDAAS